MTRDDVMTILAPIIEGEIIRIDEYQIIEIDAFVERFGDADLTYESLSQHPKARPGSGWDVSFAEWRDRGLLS